MTLRKLQSTIARIKSKRENIMLTVRELDAQLNTLQQEGAVLLGITLPSAPSHYITKAAKPNAGEKIMAIMPTGSNIALPEIASKAGIPRVHASIALASLVDSGAIERVSLGIYRLPA